MTIKQELIAEGLKRFPNAGIKTVARALYKENPAVWPNLEACYSGLRRATGSIKDKPKQIIDDRGGDGKPGDAVKLRFPQGLRHNKNFGPYEVKGVKRALLLYDVHAPYHDEENMGTQKATL